MKKLSKIILNPTSDLLQKEEMLLIRGKGAYRCCCGGSYNDKCINVDAANHSDATLEIAMFCTELGVSLGGGCFYNYGSV